MIYNAPDALEDNGALASLSDHHHVPNHITIDISFTYDYAVSMCRYRALKINKMKSVNPLLENKDCVIRTFVYSFEDSVHICFFKIISGNNQMTKSSKIVLDIVFCFGEQGETNLTFLF